MSAPSASTKVKYLTRRFGDQTARRGTLQGSGGRGHRKSAFDLNQYGRIATCVVRGSFIRFRDSLLSGFRKILRSVEILPPSLLIALRPVSALTVCNSRDLGNLTKVDPSEFMDLGKNLVDVTIWLNMSYANVTTILDDTSAPAGVSPCSASMMLGFRSEDYYQGSANRARAAMTNGFPVPVSRLGSYGLVAAYAATSRDVDRDIRFVAGSDPATSS
ncbi:MAG: hypothetical protein MZU97_13850 [Bacillus subtilis]|nr:hypothetical protein [Bacillus subtilis]